MYHRIRDWYKDDKYGVRQEWLPKCLGRRYIKRDTSPYELSILLLPDEYIGVDAFKCKIFEENKYRWYYYKEHYPISLNNLKNLTLIFPHHSDLEVVLNIDVETQTFFGDRVMKITSNSDVIQQMRFIISK